MELAEGHLCKGRPALDRHATKDEDSLFMNDDAVKPQLHPLGNLLLGQFDLTFGVVLGECRHM